MKLLLSILLTCLVSGSQAQGDSLKLVNLNQQIDDLVVSRDTSSLLKLYAADFVFSHGSGRVEGRANWIRSVARNNYPERKHDSVKVELHPSFAVVKGKMFIKRVDKEKTAVYHLRYIRVFARQGDHWQLASHSTTHEWHDN